jgi:O-acetyl-ADP-ribose deacetylase (regulator of RNase III)
MSCLKRVRGDLLKMADEGLFDVIVHGCNCFNNMGAGIALSIAEKYHAAVVADNATDRGSYDKLGNYTTAQLFSKTNPVKPFRIINAYTQFGAGGGSDLFEYASFELILKKLAHHHAGKTFGFPYIGMGLAGGDPVRIISMLESFADSKLVQFAGGSATLVEYAP